jgi:5'-3' exonuclease
MGIPSFFSHIIKSHSSIIKKMEQKSKKTFNHLYMDCNSIIYDVVNELKSNHTPLLDNEINNNNIINNVIKNIEKYIELTKPTKSIVIAFDGGAPLAKMKQQRERRFKSTFQSDFINNFNKISTNKNNEYDINNREWSTLMITPGTLFMDKLNNTLYAYFNNPSKYNVHSITMSGSNEKGEGEHKLFNILRKTSKITNNENTLIYGLDADLIMLSLNHLRFNDNIYLFRDTPSFITSINNNFNINDTYYMDINKLAEIINSNMNKNNKISRIDDYIFICFMLGNDFMPHFPSLNIRTNGINKLMNAYLDVLGNTNKKIIENNEIVWTHFYLFINFLSTKEEEYIIKETSKRNHYKKKFFPIKTNEDIINKFTNIPSIDLSIEKYINPKNIGWQNRYYEKLFSIYYMNPHHKKNICTNYLQGLEWCFKYYNGYNIDWEWKYNYKYPPLLQDLIHYIPNTKYTFINEKYIEIPNIVQLCYVLPRSGLYILPNNIGKNIIEELSSKYPINSNCDITWAYCKYFWESHVTLPDISLRKLEYIINKKNNN